MTLDFDNLANEFNTGSEFNLDGIGQAAIDIEKAIQGDNVSDPDRILSDNIGKANAILDRIITEINRSGMSPRLGEVSSQLITAINMAASQLYTKDFNIGNLQLKSRMLQLKEREIELKEKVASQHRPGTVNQNLIITDRETVLKMLQDSKEKIKLLENTKNVEDKGDHDGKF